MEIPSGVKRYFKNLDYILILAAVACSAYGIIICKSATAYLHTDRYFYTQLIATVIGIALMIGISMIDYDTAMRFSKYYFVLMVGLLVLTLLIGHGDEIGSKSWISIPGVPFNIQTAEFAKLIFAVTFAAHLSWAKENINDIKNILLLVAHMGIIVGLVFLQGDLGSALVFIVMALVMSFYAGINIWYYIGALAALVVASPIVWKYLPEYRKMRILVGFNPDLDPLDWGYQQLQSRKAISLGKIVGMGYQNGYLTSSGKVPKQQTDFALAVVGENFGLIGCLLAIILLAIVVFRILRCARKSRDDAGSFICAGIASLLIFQIIENVGMCLGLLPVIGIPLPFFSYGGSSVLSIYIGLGIVLAVGQRRSLYRDLKYSF